MRWFWWSSVTGSDGRIWTDELGAERHQHVTGPVYPKGPAWQRVFGRLLPVRSSLPREKAGFARACDRPCGPSDRGLPSAANLSLVSAGLRRGSQWPAWRPLPGVCAAGRGRSGRSAALVEKNESEDWQKAGRGLYTYTTAARCRGPMRMCLGIVASHTCRHGRCRGLTGGYGRKIHARSSFPGGDRRVIRVAWHRWVVSYGWDAGKWGYAAWVEIC